MTTDSNTTKDANQPATAQESHLKAAEHLDAAAQSHKVAAEHMASGNSKAATQHISSAKDHMMQAEKQCPPTNK